MLDQQKVKQVRLGLTQFFDKACTIFGTDEVILELMSLRGYTSQAMFDTLKRFGVYKMEYLSDITLTMPEYTNEHLNDFGLLTGSGNYLLTSRYVLPIRDIGGTVIALVGWHPQGGSRKYVTTPTMGFSRDVSFFNYDSYKLSWEKFGGVTFMDEGIFDTIALSSLGLPCIGMMGLEMSNIKSQMLTRYTKTVAIPDNDTAGKSVSPYTNAVSGKGKKFEWTIPTESVWVSLPRGVKDPDDFVRDFDCYDDLISCIDAKYVKKLKEDL